MRIKSTCWLSVLLTFLFSVVSVFYAGPAMGGSGISPSVLVLPKGPGSLGGVGENVKANLNMGLMSYSIPIFSSRFFPVFKN